ncbi:hypothetical protein B0O99DRAFT_597240 [Bisporella sp. PMI_857]|nr:hypothetical protein B0O99DRAFT_597240 [Bisporella sp. PMI_857]
MPRLAQLSALCRTAVLLLLVFAPAVTIDTSEVCNYDLIYSPFTPYFKPWRNVTTLGGGNEDRVKYDICWWYANCCFSHMPETRKQQHAATALVMGLIPLILKDIAWPRRRIAFVPRLLPWYVETLIRALGLNPVVGNMPLSEGMTFKKRFKQQKSRALLVALIVLLLSSYGVLVVVELYSKWSALGCSVPAFIAIWFFVALIPAAVEVGAARYQRHQVSVSVSETTMLSATKDRTSEYRSDNVNLTVSADSVPGAEKGIVVQVFWALYYAAGTLVFTSIMMVTVLELVVWLLAASATTIASKMLGYKLCGYWGTGLRD